MNHAQRNHCQSTRQERAQNAIASRGIECEVGALIDITFLVDVLAAANGVLQTTLCELGTAGHYIELSPPGEGSYQLVELFLDAGENTAGDLGAAVAYVGEIKSGSTADARDVWGGSTSELNRTGGPQLTPDSRLYVNTDPLRVGQLRRFSEKQKLRIVMGNCGASDITCLNVLATFQCAGLK